MSIINCIEHNFKNAIIPKCSEHGCSLKLDDLSNYVVLKGENVCKSQPICDCIIFLENTNIIGIIELKSKTAHSSEIEAKLTNGSKIALEILKMCNDIKCKFYHIVLAKRWRSSEYRVITQKKIKIEGKKYNIIPKRCGTYFSAVITRL